MRYVLISGEVRDLKISKGYDDLANLSDGSKQVIGWAAIVAAATGNGVASSTLASGTHGAEIDMEYFRCLVGDVRVVGRFHRVGFQNGKRIDFVVSLVDGVAQVEAARDRERQYIWTLPHRMRGHIAQKRADIVASFVVSCIAATLALGLAVYNTPDPIMQMWPWLVLFTSICFISTLVGNAFARWPFYRFSYESSEIFRAFGFANPAAVDLQCWHNRADKEYCRQTGEAQPLVVPWRFRYPKREVLPDSDIAATVHQTNDLPG